MTADAMGGVWTYAMELAGHLARRGVQISIATMGARPTEEQRRRAEDIPGLLLFESDFKLEWMDDPWDDVAQAGAWLLDLERRLKPDVVHLNGYCHGALPWRAPAIVVGHSCVLSWWEAVKGEPAPSRYARYQREVARGIRAATRLIAPTRAMLTSLRRHYGPHPAARVILNGHDPWSFVVAAKEPIVFSATRVWDEAKNVAALAKAADGLSWPVFVAGETKAPCQSSSAATRGKTAPEADAQLKTIILLGKLDRPDVMGWMTRAAIFALPARYEPFGLSALEAACAGSALVLGDIPSLREIWGDAAVFVPPLDPSAIREALRSLALDDRRRALLARRGRARGLAMSSARMAQQYHRIYIELAGASPRRSERSRVGERTA
jgi:glycosyltransferase involved in cell wall biosynthesis